MQLSLSLLLSARPRSLLVLLQRNSQSVSQSVSQSDRQTDRRTYVRLHIQSFNLYSFVWATSDSCVCVSHHPLQEELQFLRPLVVVLRLVQLLLDDLQTNGVIKTSFDRRAAPQISPI